MRLLLMTTCGAEGLAALADETAVLAEQTLPGRGAGEALLPALKRLFAQAGGSPRELTAVAVVDGPGSFTGIRVGLSAAKGLADAAGCGLVAISRLWLLAAAGGEQPLALLDAGRGDVFAGWFQDGHWSERLLSAEAAAALAKERTIVACEPSVAERFHGDADGFDRSADTSEAVMHGAAEIAQSAAVLTDEPGAQRILAEALRRIRAGQWSDAATADANYLRRTDAELVADSTEARQ